MSETYRRVRRLPEVTNDIITERSDNTDSTRADFSYDVEQILKLLANENTESIRSDLDSIMLCDFNMDLAFSLFECEHIDEALRIQVADWIRNQSQPNISVVEAMLTSEISKIRKIAGSWVLSMFDFSDKLLQVMFKSKHNDVIQIAKRWFARQKDNMGFYVIKRKDEEIEINYEGVRVDNKDFPDKIIDALNEVSLEIDIEAQKVFMREDVGWQLVVHGINKISDTSLRNLITSMNEKAMMVAVVADALGWDDIDNPIVSNDVFQEYLKTSQ